MSNELSLQTPPSKGAGVELALSPALRVMMRNGNLGVLLSFLDAGSIPRLMSVQRFAFVDKELALAAVLRCMLRLVPELELKAWHEALEKVERSRAIPVINGVYLSFLHDTGPGISRNLSHPSSLEFVKEWLDEADPRTFGDLLRSGYFASRVKRAALIRILTKKELTIQNWMTNQQILSNQVQIYRESEEMKRKSYRMLRDIAQNSFSLEWMNVNGRAWGNTGMREVSQEFPRLYVSVSKEYVENQNRTLIGEPLFRPFEYDRVSGGIWGDAAGSDVPFPSPPLTWHEWHQHEDGARAPSPTEDADATSLAAPWSFPTDDFAPAPPTVVAAHATVVTAWTDSESL